MIVVKLSGGLGNQMFQYAAARTLSLLKKSALKADLSAFDRLPERYFALDCFTLQIDSATAKDKAQVFGGSFFYRLFPKTANTYFSEKHYHFQDDFFNQPDNAYLEGYFQSEKYFLAARDVIRRDFTFKKKLSVESEKFMVKIEKTATPISLHFRITDFLRSARSDRYHFVLSKDYYRRALTLIKKSVSKPVFFIFSDDLAFVRKNYKMPSKVVFIERQKKADPWEDLQLMSRCRHHIIANSSFSWWAAWLNGYKKKTVIAPKIWFDKGPADTQDLLPEKWLKL